MAEEFDGVATFGEATRPLETGMGALSRSESESDSLKFELESLSLSLDDSESALTIAVSFMKQMKNTKVNTARSNFEK